MIKSKTGIWDIVIGLEVHAQISSNTKLFSGAKTAFGSSPNSQVSLVDAALPGMLPVLNEHCVKQAIKTGLALCARINKRSRFDRKNYFYPDLPQGYQISQFYEPIVEDGYIDITLEDGSSKRIKINRLHLEQDAGKSIHDQSPHYTLIDLNRAGIALMEIVSEPDLSSAYEVTEYVKKLRSILRYVGSCDGDMEKGSMRCDVNISVRRQGEALGTRCEIKNVNSLKYITKAIEFEVNYQIETIEAGSIVIQETKLFDPLIGETKAMRSKEDAQDYRYFPDPDLMPIILDDNLIDEIRNELPELPDAKKQRYMRKMGLSDYDAEIIIADSETASFFEEAANNCTNNKLLANWFISEFFGALNKHSVSILDNKIKPTMLRDLVNLIDNKVISGKIAKTIFEEMFTNGLSPQEIIKTKNLVQVSDSKALSEIIEKVLNNNPNVVDNYKNGKDKLFGFFVGQVMKITEGKANPTMVNDLLREKLS